MPLWVVFQKLLPLVIYGGCHIPSDWKIFHTIDTRMLFNSWIIIVIRKSFLLFRNQFEISKRLKIGSSYTIFAFLPFKSIFPKLFMHLERVNSSYQQKPIRTKVLDYYYEELTKHDFHDHLLEQTKPIFLRSVWKQYM